MYLIPSIPFRFLLFMFHELSFCYGDYSLLRIFSPLFRVFSCSRDFFRFGDSSFGILHRNSESISTIMSESIPRNEYTMSL